MKFRIVNDALQQVQDGAAIRFQSGTRTIYVRAPDDTGVIHRYAIDHWQNGDWRMTEHGDPAAVLNFLLDKPHFTVVTDYEHPE